MKTSLVGRWSLQHCIGRSGNKTMHPLGEEPVGMLIYTQEHMIAFISSGARQRFSTDDIRAIPAAEIIANFATFETYFGSYRIDEQQKIVTHLVQSSKIPNHIGTPLCRSFRLEADSLVLTSTDALWLDGRPWIFELFWKKQESLTAS
jgi:hypothetical protein